MYSYVDELGKPVTAEGKRLEGPVLKSGNFARTKEELLELAEEERKKSLKASGGGGEDEEIT